MGRQMKAKKKRARKPDSIHTSCQAEWDIAYVSHFDAVALTDGFISAKDARRLSAWLLLAADWLEAGEGENG